MAQTDIFVRREQAADYSEIRCLVRDAFAGAEHSDSDEHNLIDRIRDSDEYIGNLSLVAVMNGRIAGHVMFSSIHVGNVAAVALAPLAVRTGFQGKGIGRALVKCGHDIAREMGYPYSVVLGYPGYYSRFGYVRAADFGIAPTFEVPEECFMICPFVDSTRVPSGIVRYSGAFLL